MASRFATFFHLTHPTKGDIPGPWVRMEDVKLQKLALDVAKVWTEWDVDEGLKRSVGKAVKGIEWASGYWA
jgi:pre-rRNA-processing protein IPI1